MGPIEDNGAKIVNRPGALDTLSVSYDALRLKAGGYFIGNHVYCVLTGANTGNDVPACP